MNKKNFSAQNTKIKMQFSRRGGTFGAHKRGTFGAHSQRLAMWNQFVNENNLRLVTKEDHHKKNSDFTTLQSKSGQVEVTVAMDQSINREKLIEHMRNMLKNI